MAVKETRVVPLASILVGDFEARTAEDDPELPALAASIRRDGLIEALGVRETPAGLMLVHGHRRYSACILARCTTVRVDILVGDDATMERVSIIENYHRKDVTAMERAAQIAHVVDSGAMTVEELAETFGRSVEWVREQVDMMDWPEDVRAAVHRRQLSPAAGQHLARITNEAYRVFLVRTAVENGCTERTAVCWLQGWRAEQPALEVVSQPVPAAGPGVKVAVPEVVCVGCLGRRPPDGLGIAYLCPECLVALQSGHRIRGVGSPGS